MQKITPFLRFDNNAEEAMEFYTSLFDDSKIINKRYHGEAGPWKKWSFMTGTMELAGFQFHLLNGWPMFQFSPAISFFVTCETEEQVDRLYTAFADGGIVMMELKEYDFSPKYARIQDKFWVSRQISLWKASQAIIPSFLFVGDQYLRTTEAVQYYTSLFKNSALEMTVPYEPSEGEKPGAVKYTLFSLAWQKFSAMDSGYDHKFSFTPAISMFVNCSDQTEVDYLRDSLSNDGAIEQCGRLRDKFGISRQIIPTVLGTLLSDPNPVKTGNVMQAMMQMKKIDIAGLQEAYDKE